MHRKFILMGLVLAGVCAAEEDRPRPRVLQNAENIHDLRYLPDDRYTGSQCSQGDWRKTLNLYLPKGAKGPLPLVIYVHGGGYGGGHKEEGYQVPLMQRLVDRGIAVASMNYILGTGIFPQVFWDFEDASRFLRTNAARYRLDPCAFGAVGISAGGWLISAAGHADGRTFATETNHFDHALTMRGPTWTSQQIRIGEGSFLRPVLAATTAYPGVYGRFQAMAFDFHMVPQAANGWTPAILQFCSIGTDRPHEAFAAAGVDWTAAVLTDPKEAGKGVHAPPWNAAARPLDGGADRELADVVVDWYARTLTGPMARTPVAEIWPTQRFISAPIDVSILVPDASITVHVTTDGSEPNTASPRYTAPFRIVPGTTVRALSVMRGRKPSRVVDAVFASSTQLPAFTGPVGDELPPATTGKPYKIHFTADRPGARFDLQGSLRPYIPWWNKDRSASTLFHPNNMLLAADGTWSGVPTTPGTFLYRCGSTTVPDGLPFSGRGDGP